jgi:hypothetical protein
VAQGLSLIHIGLPKTATTALQTHFFPKLALPYVPYGAGDWYKKIRLTHDYVPVPLGYRATTSGENLCNQGMVGSNAMAERLHKMFGDAIVLMVVRRTDEHFVSWYRQMIMSDISRFADQRAKAIAAGEPAHQMKSFMDINRYFDDNLDLNLRAAQNPALTLVNSYFMTMDLDRNLDAFRRLFEVMVVDYDMITSDFAGFSKLVCARLDIPAPDVSLERENISGVESLEALLARLPDDLIVPDFRPALIERYKSAKLSPDRAAFLEAFTQLRCGRTFAEAVRTA